MGGYHPGLRYGTPNWEMMARWTALAPAQDGPFWALNLMRYRALADYADGRESTLSGREADDIYAPVGPLEAIGAMPAFLGDVVEQTLGSPSWERVGIVRYPSRAAFFAMQQREDFRELHAHKDAGMESTIVMSCLPTAFLAPEQVHAAGELVLSVARVSGGGEFAAAEHPGVCAVASFEVEGVIVGDQRSFTQARFEIVDGEEAMSAVRAAGSPAEECLLMRLEPSFENLLGSLVGAQPTAGT